MRELHPITVLAFFDELEKIAEPMFEYSAPQKERGLIRNWKVGRAEKKINKEIDKALVSQFEGAKRSGYTGNMAQFEAEISASRNNAYNQTSKRIIEKTKKGYDKMANPPGAAKGVAEALGKHKGKILAGALAAGALYGYSKTKAKDEDNYYSGIAQ